MKSKRLHYIALASLLFVCGLMFGYFQFSDQLADPDAFYHMRIAQLIYEQGIITDFTWLPYTTLSQHYVDQHLLYHVLMIPFVVTGVPLVGVKVYTVLLAILFLGTFALMLRSFKSPWWLVSTAVLAVCIPFTFRLNLVKATPLALTVLSLALFFLAKKWYWALLPVGIVYVWVYGGFAMLLIVVGIWVVSELIEQWKQRSVIKPSYISALQPLGIAVIGLIIGLVLNPYFPQNLMFYWDQLVQIGIINYQDTIGVGAEWYPYHPGRLLLGSIGIVLLACGGYIASLIRKQPWRQLDWFAFFIFLAGLGLTLKSRRYVEYFGPFTALAGALWLRHSVPQWSAAVRLFSRHGQRAIAYTGLTMAVVILVVPIVLNDASRNRDDIRSGISINRYAAASDWLQSNATPGSKLLHSDWDDFPMLFYHNSNNAYMAGLDPTFMYRYDADLYELWKNITLGEYAGDISAALSTLDVEYVIIEKNHVKMYNLINEAPAVDLAYSDDEVDIFYVDYK